MHSRLILALGLSSGVMLAACATPQPQPRTEAPSVTHTAKPLSDSSIAIADRGKKQPSRQGPE